MSNNSMLAVPAIAYLIILALIIICMVLYAKITKLSVQASNVQQVIVDEESENHLLTYFKECVEGRLLKEENYSHWEFLSEADKDIRRKDYKRIRVFYTTGSSVVRRFKLRMIFTEDIEDIKNRDKSKCPAKKENKNEKRKKENSKSESSPDNKTFDLAKWYEEHEKIISDIRATARKNDQDYCLLNSETTGIKDLELLIQIRDLLDSKAIFCSIDDDMNLLVGA